MRLRNKKQGFGLLESVIGAAVLMVVFTGGMAVFSNSLRLGAQSVNLTQVSFLLQEGAEVLRLWRDRDWNNLADLVPGTDYYFNWNGSDWAVSQSPVVIDGVFTRKFRIFQVYRDANDDIAETGTLDPNTRRLEVTITWQNGATPVSRSLKFYLTNLFDT